jgi:hypothetical protein
LSPSRRAGGAGTPRNCKMFAMGRPRPFRRQHFDQSGLKLHEFWGELRSNLDSLGAIWSEVVGLHANVPDSGSSFEKRKPGITELQDTLNCVISYVCSKRISPRSP